MVIYSTSLEVECFQEFLFSLLSKLKASEFGRFAMVLWAIWRTRNDWFGGMLVQVLESLFIMPWVFYMIGCRFIVRLEKILFWFLESVASGMYPKVPLLLVLLMLPFSHELGKTGLGIVVCDSHRSFLFGQSSWLDGCLPVQEGEAVGVREALS